MKTTLKKKLALKKESLAVLSQERLRRIAGGPDTTALSCGGPRTWCMPTEFHVCETKWPCAV